jgi:hypothetical protein
MIGSHLIASLAAIALMFVCYGAPQASEQSWTKFETHLQACSEKHGYERRRSRTLGEHELGPGERAWRECAYSGVRSILMPRSGLEDSFTRVIVQDKVMTDKVAEGKMTRDERQQRLEKLVAQLHAAEKRKAAQEMDKMHADFTARMDEIRRMQRLNRIMR